MLYSLSNLISGWETLALEKNQNPPFNNNKQFLEKFYLNCNVHTNYLEILLKWEFWLIRLGGAWVSAFLISSQVMPELLVCRCLRRLYRKITFSFVWDCLFFGAFNYSVIFYIHCRLNPGKLTCLQKYPILSHWLEVYKWGTKTNTKQIVQIQYISNICYLLLYINLKNGKPNVCSQIHDA